ncbi:S41 family peptidase [Massilia sp. TN1-12]|uniref:S41 family peptidase n=1 Tax=Massilia paldalensis TaxID=3377675 RepID=UPI00384E7019
MTPTFVSRALALAALVGTASLAHAAPADAANAADAARPPVQTQDQLVLPQAEVEKLLAAYALIKQNYVGQADDKKLFDGALAGMLASLDPHSSYLDKDAMLDIQRENTGEYVGIGVEVEEHQDELRIVSTSDGSPAARAGLVPNDVIVSVDGTAVAGMSTEEVGRRMRGVPGTVVTLGVTHAGHFGNKLTTLRIAREELHNATVQTRMAGSGVAWIRISEFGGATGADLAAALRKLDGKEPPRGLILDLRNDPGGLVAAGVAVAGAFLPPGTVLFSARGREDGANAVVTVDQRFYRGPGEPDVLAGLPAWTRTVPLAVLVNGASASAAELVTGALQDQHRATVIGTQTFGKGSIQSVIPLGQDDAVKFTVARYFTPNGREIQAHGITPDMRVLPRGVDRDDLLLRESDLANHLRPASATADSAARDPVEPSRLFGTRDDKALQAAVTLLASSDQRKTGLSGLLHRWSAALKFGKPKAAPAAQ